MTAFEQHRLVLSPLVAALEKRRDRCRLQAMSMCGATKGARQP
jgi:hypothetical protein